MSQTTDQIHCSTPASQARLQNRLQTGLQNQLGKHSNQHRPWGWAIAALAGSTVMAGTFIAPVVTQAQVLVPETTPAVYSDEGALTAQSSSSLLDQPLTSVSEDQFSHFGTLVIVAGLAAWIITMCKDG
jgi:hypothetical protein